jgi:putative membrane protein
MISTNAGERLPHVWQLGFSASAALLALAGSGGCSTTAETTSNAAAPAPIVTRSAPIAALMPSAYFAAATSIDLFELRAADIALKRSTGAGRSFALQAKQHHQALSAQFAFAGRYLDLLPSRTLPPEYQQMLNLLLSTNDFDRVYLAQQRLVCARALQLHSQFAQAGSSPTLRPVAQFGVSIAASDLQLLRH